MVITGPTRTRFEGQKPSRGFESPSLRQMSIQDMIAGPRATEDCEPRQVRKEAAVAITDVCYGNPGYHLFQTGAGI